VPEPLSILKFSGVMDVRSIQKPFRAIKKAAARGRDIQIDLAAVTEIDITFVQLIESARRSAAQAGTGISLTKPAAGMVLETLQRGGFLSEPPDARTRFWTGQGQDV
jgi:ABC-type transporter Mla MlaB component